MICKRALTRRATQTAELPRKVNYNILHLFKKLGRDLKNLVPEDPQDAAMFSMFYDSKLHTATEENLFFVATDPKILASNLSGADSAKLKKTFGFLNVATPAQQGGGAVRRNQYAPYSLPDAALPERPVRPNPTPAVSQVYFLSFFSLDTLQSVLLRFFDITCTIIRATVFQYQFGTNFYLSTFQVPSDEIEKHKAYFEPALHSTQPHDKVSLLTSSARSTPQLDRAFWKHYCKNCYWLGKWDVHNLTACKAAGNPCKVQCPTCNKLKKGKVYHWTEDCPNKKTSL
jgi:hypothetical protein